MRIAHISDTHIQAANPDVRSRVEDLARAVDSINALAQPADIIIHSGDIAHDATAGDYGVARAELARLNAPVYTTIGNRDRRRPYFDSFARDGYLDPATGFAQYAVDLGGLLLVAVDTQDEASALGGFCDVRARHLRALLAMGRQQPTLVFAHHPPLELPDMKAPNLQYRDAGEAALLVDCLKDCAGLIGVVSGHVHRARAVPLGNVTLSTVPSLAGDLSREKAGENYLRRPIYQVHDVDVAAGRVATRAIMLERSGCAAA